MTDVEIANVALGLIGQAPLGSLADNTNAAILTNSFFGLARDTCLEQRDWTFATARAQLVQDLALPINDYAYRFALPPGTLRFIRAVDINGQQLTRYKREGNFILTDELPVYAELVTRQLDTSAYSPSFCTALAYALAALLCIPITENRGLKTDLEGELKQKLIDAAANDGRQGTSERKYTMPLPGRRPR